MTAPAPQRARTPGALLLVVTVMALPAVALLASAYLDHVYTVVDSSWRRVTIVQGNAARNVQILGTLLLVPLSAHVVYTEVRRGTRPDVLLPVTALVVAVATFVRGAEANVLLGTVAMLATVVAASFVRLDHATLRAAGWYAVAFLGSNWLFWATGDPQAVKECREDKCSFLGSMLQGYTQHEQTLGLYSALLIPVLAFLPRPVRRAGVVLAVVTVLATGSRTSLGSVAVALLAYWLLEGVADEPEGTWTVRRGQRALHQLLAFAPLAALLAALVLFFLLPPGALTGRGQVWAVVRGALAEHPVFGPGRDALEHGYATGNLDFVAYTEHSQAGYLLAAGGVVALLLMVAVLTRWAVHALGPGLVSVLLALAPALSFATEVPWTLTAFSSTYWTLFLCAALRSTTLPARPADRPTAFGGFVRRSARTVAVTALVGLAAGLLVGALGPQIYRSTASVFLAARSTRGGLFESSLYTQGLTRSYAQAVTSQRVVQDALQRLGWADDPDEIARHVTAEVPFDTVIVRLTVDQPTPERAERLADALATSAADLLPQLAAPEAGRSPIRATVTGAASDPGGHLLTALAPPAFDGLLLGTAAGLLAAAALSGRRTRVRDEGLVRDVAPEVRVVTLHGPDGGGGPAAGPLAQHTVATGAATSVLVVPVDRSEDAATVVRWMAADAAAAGREVCIVDLARRTHGGRRRQGLSEVLVGEVALRSAAVRVPATGATLLLAGRRPEALSAAGPRRMAAVVEELEASFDLTLVTGPPLTTAASMTVAGTVDRVVVVARAGVTPTERLTAGLARLRTLARSQVTVAVVSPGRPVGPGL